MQEFERLEKEWAEFNELEPENMVVCNSGTAALHLAFESLQEFFPIKEGAIACPSFSMVACPRAIAMAGMIPAWVDVDFKTRVVQDKRHPYHRPVGNLIVHTYGRRAPFIRWHEGPVVEDLAEAHGVKPYEETDAACWSFYKNKIVAGEEGGAVYFKNKEAANYARRLRCIGMGDVHNFQVIPRGHNYRLSNCHASLILESLNNFQSNFYKRKQIWNEYETELGTLSTPVDAPWVFDFLLPRYLTPEHVVGYMNKRGIAARFSFYPNHKQQEWRKERKVNQVFPISEQLYDSLIYFPIDPDMGLDEVKRVVNTYKELLV